jgi:DNA-3-methyladenine glycosylase II
LPGSPKSARAKALAALRASDPVLRGVIDSVGADNVVDPRSRLAPDHYGALVRSIVGQQLSTISAGAIYGRLKDRYGGQTPTPQEVLDDDPDEMRVAAGLSHAKVAYLRSLAEHVLDDEVIADLTAVRGIGTWSSHMFLMFQLLRPDVLPVGDLGIRRAFMVHWGFEKLPKPAEMEPIGEPWRPHRTLASLFLWRSIQATPV